MGTLQFTVLVHVVREKAVNVVCHELGALGG